MKSLRAQRQARKWSRAELARRAGMHASTVGLIESGRLKPYPGQIAKLISALQGKKHAADCGRCE